MNNLPVAITCVTLREVSTIVCIYSFMYVYSWYFSSLTFSVFFRAGQPREFKHKIREEKPSGRCTPLFPQYETVGARMQTFTKWSLSAQSLSETGFFSSVKYFTIELFCTCKNNSSKKSTNIVFSGTGPGSLVSCYYSALTLQNLKDSDCIYTKHFEYNPYCIHLVQKAPKFFINDKWFYRSAVSFKKLLKM
jgi:hypothetical protein